MCIHKETNSLTHNKTKLVPLELFQPKTTGTCGPATDGCKHGINQHSSDHLPKEENVSIFCHKKM